MNEAMQAMLRALGGESAPGISDYAMPVLLIGVIGVIGWTLWKRDRDTGHGFSFDDLLCDPITGITDPARCVLVGSWIAMTWVFVWLAMHDRLNDVFTMVYAGCYVAPIIVKIFRVPVMLPGVGSSSPSEAVTTTTTKTKITQGEP